MSTGEMLVMFGGVGRKNAQVSMGGVTHHAVGRWLEQIRAGARE
jgi:biotin/methionine sulfoxide reductase